MYDILLGIILNEEYDCEEIHNLLLYERTYVRTKEHMFFRGRPCFNTVKF